MEWLIVPVSLMAIGIALVLWGKDKLKSASDAESAAKSRMRVLVGLIVLVLSALGLAITAMWQVFA